MANGENTISFFDYIVITIGKAVTIHSALRKEIEKCSGVENLRGFESDGASVILGHKKVVSQLKRDNHKIIYIHCHNYTLAIAILLFFNENTFLMKNNSYFTC